MKYTITKVLIKKYNTSYYLKDNSLVYDNEYDLLFFRLKSL